MYYAFLRVIYYLHYLLCIIHAFCVFDTDERANRTGLNFSIIYEHWSGNVAHFLICHFSNFEALKKSLGVISNLVVSDQS